MYAFFTGSFGKDYALFNTRTLNRCLQSISTGSNTSPLVIICCRASKNFAL
jgi:hypothetical protein